MFRPVHNVYLFMEDVFVEKLLGKSSLRRLFSQVKEKVNSYNVKVLRNLSKRVDEVCDLLNLEADRVCKEIEARSS